VRPFASGPTDLSHRDYMAWNLHRHGGTLVMIDFQDALIAPDAFDLAQLLTDRTTSTLLTPDDSRALIERSRAEARRAGSAARAGIRRSLRALRAPARAQGDRDASTSSRW
jgi:aminoglycoside/choline kinase family phosphotransferase